MRQTRLKLNSESGRAYYHCVSRVVDKRMAFGPGEKDQFVEWMLLYARFCGVRVLTYCIMSNHFHLLVEVSRPPATPPCEEELLRLHAMVREDDAAEIQRKSLMTLPEKQRQEWRTKQYAQMWDVSAYIKLLKQRFTQWFNRSHRRKGGLWEERFKSVLVEGSEDALARMAAYIDLNPIRAQLVLNPKDYPWCGYAAAMAGQRLAREGIRGIIYPGESDHGTLAEAITRYRLWLFGEGKDEGSPVAEAPKAKTGLSPEKVREVFAEKGKLEWKDFVRCRVRYFTDGTAVGSKEWVNQVFEDNRQRFSPKRKDGARKFRFLNESGIFGMRDLRIDPVTPPPNDEDQPSPSP